MKMKTIMLVTASLMIASSAHAEPHCWAWILKGENLTCEQRGPDTSGQADAIAREAQRRNNAARSYESTTTSVDGDGKVTGTTTTTTLPPYYRR